MYNNIIPIAAGNGDNQKASIMRTKLLGLVTCCVVMDYHGGVDETVSSTGDRKCAKRHESLVATSLSSIPGWSVE